jgi:hypothetical protein
MDNVQGIKTKLFQSVHETMFLEAVEARYNLAARNPTSRPAHSVNFTERRKRICAGIEWRQFHGSPLQRLLNTHIKGRELFISYIRVLIVFRVHT